MKKVIYLYSFMLALFICSESYGQGDPLIGALDQIGIFQGFGKSKHISVFEDVDEIQMEPTFGSCGIPCFNPSSLPSYAVRNDNKDNYLSNAVPGAMISEDYSSTDAFIESNFYLEYGDENSPRKISNSCSDATEKFPHQDDNKGQDPGSTLPYYYCIGKEHSFINDSFDPRFIPITPVPSCNFARHLCELGEDCPHDSEEKSKQRNKIIRNLRSEALPNIMSNSQTFGPITRNSNIFAMITYKDRTPPRIFEEGNEESFNDYEDRFPTLEKTKKAGPYSDESINISTGDWFTFDKLQVTDNGADKVKVKVYIGEINSLPETYSKWTESEIWSSIGDDGKSKVFELNDYNSKKQNLDNFTTIPNYCFGYMRYSVFAQELKTTDSGEILGNLNPGCATIVENHPEKCYGLPGNEEDNYDLGTNPNRADSWPFSFQESLPICNIDSPTLLEDLSNPDNINNLSKADKTNLEGGKVKEQEGLIRISDNDYPNILIKLTSKKDGKQLFFPPCMKPAGLNFDDPTNLTGDNRPSKIYNTFVNSTEIYEQCIYDNIVANEENIKKKPYYTIFGLKPFDFTDNGTRNLLNRFIKNSDIDFINKHFRLEDQTESDTTPNGELDKRIDDENGQDLLGKHNGTWKEVVALIGASPDTGIIIQEDVEYDLDIWVDDSVRWANVDNERSPYDDYIKAIIPTGVKSCEVKIKIPNQSPSIDKSYDLPKYNYSLEKNINNIDRIVFREPTKNVNIESLQSESDLISNRLPSISVEAEDYSGNKRKIRLYFYVTDENANVRTLQRKHGKH